MVRVAEVDLHDEVVGWLASLGDPAWNRAVVVIDRLASLASRARMPLSRSLDGALFELRFSLGSTARRITYRFTSDGRIVLLTTFRKQRDNERAEVARARNVAERCARSDPRRET
ncbi:MAG: type II toxin-antitoxin system RelE/ParE family toxin [Acidimicrobiaceae bacterium]|nr:type II toxin-antitoxin system RelE/ParE family toxin [Acidimicrobiaceae bacterium]